MRKRKWKDGKYTVHEVASRIMFVLRACSFCPPFFPHPRLCFSVLNSAELFTRNVFLVTAWPWRSQDAEGNWKKTITLGRIWADVYLREIKIDSCGSSWVFRSVNCHRFVPKVHFYLEACHLDYFVISSLLQIQSAPGIRSCRFVIKKLFVFTLVVRIREGVMFF